MTEVKTSMDQNAKKQREQKVRKDKYGTVVKGDNHGRVAIFEFCIPFMPLFGHPVSQTISDIEEEPKAFFAHTAGILTGPVDTIFQAIDIKTGVIIQPIK